MRPRHGATLRGLRRQEELTAWLFVAPVALGILIWQVYPVLYSLYVSFTAWNFVSAPRWTGLQNYTQLFASDQFFSAALRNSAVYAVGTVVPTVVLGVLFAVILNSRIRGRAIYRTLYFLPNVTPIVSIAIVWAWMYDSNFGILNFLLKLIGIAGPRWLGSSDWAMTSLIIMDVWHGLGFSIILLLAGLQSIGAEYYEAATIDGADAFEQFWHVTLPLLSPMTFLVLILALINAFQVFDSPYVLTQGGPANATLTLVLYLYNQGFADLHMGLASAVAYCLFVIILVLTGLSFYLQKLWVFYEEGQ